MNEIGDPKRVILSIYFSQPYLLDDASHLKNVGGILASFGVSDDALMDVLTGKFKPQGKLPFALGNKPEAILRQDPDVPGYAEAETPYPFGFGLLLKRDFAMPIRLRLTLPAPATKID